MRQKELKTIDAIFEEDSTHSKNVNLSANLVVLRGDLIALKTRLVADKFWPFIRELCSMKTSLSHNMICKTH